MSIDHKYGFASLPESLRISRMSFPQKLYKPFVGALKEMKEVYREMDIGAFRQHGKLFLRVTLDVGDRPLHLLVHEDGDVLQFDAPVMTSFPSEASHFVLSELCSNNTYLSFRLDEQLLPGAAADGGAPTEVLMAWGRFELTTFLASAPMLLPYLIVKLTEAERELRLYRDEPPPQVKLVA